MTVRVFLISVVLFFFFFPSVSFVSFHPLIASTSAPFSPSLALARSPPPPPLSPTLLGPRDGRSLGGQALDRGFCVCLQRVQRGGVHLHRAAVAGQRPVLQLAGHFACAASSAVGSHRK